MEKHYEQQTQCDANRHGTDQPGRTLAFQQSLQNSLRGMAIPERRLLPGLRRTAQCSLQIAAQSLHRRQTIAAHRDRDRPFGIRSQRQARRVKISALFLQPPRIRQHASRVLGEHQRIQVTQRLQQFDRRLIAK